jgi:large subunit ribosomal protein L22
VAKRKGAEAVEAAREWRASHRYARISPQKAQLVSNLIRGRPVSEAQALLRSTPKKAALLFDRVLLSAIANADTQGNADVERLFVRQAVAHDGARWKRWRPGPRGRGMPIIKRTSHLEVVLRERPEQPEKSKKSEKSAKSEKPARRSAARAREAESAKSEKK